MWLTSIPSEYRTRFVYTCFSILFKLLELQLFIFFVTQVLVRLVLGRKAPPAAAPVLPDADYILSAGGCICALGFKVCRRQSCCIFSIRHPCLDSTALRPTYQNDPKCSNGPIVHWECASAPSTKIIFFWKTSKIMEPYGTLEQKVETVETTTPCSQLW